VIFGTTGGVIEAAVRYGIRIYTTKKLPESILRITADLMEFARQLSILTDYLSIWYSHGLGNARKLLEDIQSGNRSFMQ